MNQADDSQNAPRRAPRGYRRTEHVAFVYHRRRGASDQ